MSPLLDSDGKAEAILRVADDYPQVALFVETGSAIGDLPLRLHERFDQIVTIEFAEDYYLSAMNRLMPYPNVRVLKGDSGKMLGPTLAALDAPCIIWLDAHEIADDGYAAMAEEMVAIAYSPHDHVVLVDDARLCSGRKGWMTLAGLEGWAEEYGYDWGGVTDDVAYIFPRS